MDVAGMAAVPKVQVMSYAAKRVPRAMGTHSSIVLHSFNFHA